MSIPYLEVTASRNLRPAHPDDFAVRFYCDGRVIDTVVYSRLVMGMGDPYLRMIVGQAREFFERAMS